MLIQENLLLQRAQPDGHGGVQLLYKVNQYGISAVSRPQEEIFMIHWEVDVIKYHGEGVIAFEPCHTTDLASRTLRFNNDKSLNEFLEKAFKYFRELETLEQILPNDGQARGSNPEIGR